jgi:hypothetical protein
MEIKRALWVIFALAFLASIGAACSALGDIFPSFSTSAELTPTLESHAPQSLTPETIIATTSVSTSLETEIPSCEMDADLQAQMSEIEGQVAIVRGLQPTGPVERDLLTTDELRQYVIDDFQENYTQDEAAVDARVLVLFGLLEPDFDLWNFYIDLYSEQIAGLYDEEDQQMLVICTTSFSGIERLTYVHEYTHTLQDQVFDLEHGLGFNEDTCDDDSERCAAIQALIEGDATLLQEQWLRTYATEQDLIDLLEFAASTESPVLDSAPSFIKQDLLFPYMAGRGFVHARYLDGGWAAVDTAYTNPPLSTEQILHPDRYPSDVPVMLEIPDLAAALGVDWVEIDQGVMGEWFTQLTLNALLSMDVAVEAAEGWGGDYYLAFHNTQTDQELLVLLTQWDTMRDVHEFFSAFRNYGDLRFGRRETSSTYETTWIDESSYALIERISNQTVWILTPDAETGQRLRRFLPFPTRQQ